MKLPAGDRSTVSISEAVHDRSVSGIVAGIVLGSCVPCVVFGRHLFLRSHQPEISAGGTERVHFHAAHRFGGVDELELLCPHPVVEILHVVAAAIRPNPALAPRNCSTFPVVLRMMREV